MKHYEYAPHWEQVETVNEAFELIRVDDPQYRESGFQALAYQEKWRGEDVLTASRIIDHLMKLQFGKQHRLAWQSDNPIVSFWKAQENHNSFQAHLLGLALEALAHYCNASQAKFILNTCDGLLIGDLFEGAKAALITLNKRQIITGDEFDRLMDRIY